MRIYDPCPRQDHTRRNLDIVGADCSIVAGMVRLFLVAVLLSLLVPFQLPTCQPLVRTGGQFDGCARNVLPSRTVGRVGRAGDRIAALNRRVCASRCNMDTGWSYPSSSRASRLTDVNLKALTS